MPIVFAGITPHPPVLIPSIGKEKTAELAQTAEAFKILEQELYVAKPELILIVSPHGGMFEDIFTVNAHDSFETSFDKFGDLVTKKVWRGSPSFAANISHESHMADIPVRLVSKERLDHGTTIPLFFLTEHLSDVPILPIGFSKQSADEHVQFGIFLKDVIMAQEKRVAIIASGDLSHCLTENAPEKYRPEGKEFDQTIIQSLENNTMDNILKMDKNLVEASSQCIYQSLLITLGILNDVNISFKKLAYEAPFGIGYLTGYFEFS